MSDLVAKSPSFKTDRFEGPLDLLLYLIKKNEVNIYDIPIAQITEQYIQTLKYASEINIDELSEFQAVAATLLLIKSRMLLPADMNLGDDDDDPRQELVLKLVEYQKFKKLSQLMEEKEIETEWIMERKKLQRYLPFSDEEIWDKADIWSLLNIFSSLMANLSKERIIDMFEEVSINEKITLLNEILQERGECHFPELITRRGSVLDIVCAFLALLEAVKNHIATVLQNRMFGDILIRKGS